MNAERTYPGLRVAVIVLYALACGAALAFGWIMGAALEPGIL